MFRRCTQQLALRPFAVHLPSTVDPPIVKLVGHVPLALSAFGLAQWRWVGRRRTGTPGAAIHNQASGRERMDGGHTMYCVCSALSLVSLSVCGCVSLCVKLSLSMT